MLGRRRRERVRRSEQAWDDVTEQAAEGAAAVARSMVLKVRNEMPGDDLMPMLESVSVHVKVCARQARP